MQPTQRTYVHTTTNSDMHRRPLAAFVLLLGTVLLLLSGMAWAQSPETNDVAENRAIPELPFEDNPDPEFCGIPQRWGSNDAAWLHGYWEGELIEPVVHMYDSHLRREITGRAPSGTQVKVILFQDNPVLNYYMVEASGPDGEIQRGWVPAPFLEFEAP